jgi:hypothetical protein
MLGFGHRTAARPVPNAAFSEAYRLANERLRESGKVGSVLVRLDIDSDGHVKSSRPIDPPWITRFGESNLVLIDAVTGNRLPDPPSRTNDPEVRQLAADVAKRLTFRPATRRGRPIPHHGYRTTIAFG